MTRRSRCAVILVLLASLAALLAPLASTAGAQAPAPPDPSLDQISVADGGGGPPGDAASATPAISPDGRYVAFRSLAGNLGTPADTFQHMFLRDRLRQKTIRVSADAISCSGCDEGARPLITLARMTGPDRLRIAYQTDAALVPGDDAADGPDIYYRDVTLDSATGAPGTIGPVVLVSTTSNLCITSCSQGGTEPSLSADGRWLAFTSTYDFGYAGCSCEATADVFLADLQNPASAPALVSRADGAPGTTAQGVSAQPSVSATGAFVAFASLATNLLPSPASFPTVHVYRWAHAGGAVVNVSPADGRDSLNPTIGGLAPVEGTRVAYEVREPKLNLQSECAAGNLRSGDTVEACLNPIPFFVKNVGAGQLSIATPQVSNVSPAGSVFSVVPGSDCLNNPLDNGEECEFDVTVPAATSTAQTADLVITHNASLTPWTLHLVVPATGPVALPGPNAVPNPAPYAIATAEANGVTDVYLTDLTTGNSTWVSERFACPPAFDGGDCPSDVRKPTLSADGSTVAWTSRSGDFVAGDAEASEDIFVRDLNTGPTGLDKGPIRRLPVPLSNNVMDSPALSQDGAAVAFMSADDNSVTARPGPAPAENSAPPPTLGPPVPASLRYGAAPSASPTAHIVPIADNGVAQIYVAQYQPSPTVTAPSFGTVTVGNHSAPAQTVTVTNTGLGPMTVSGVTSSAPGEFVVVGSTCTVPLHQGQSCTIQVRFDPAQTGTRTATLTVNYVSGYTAGSATGQLSGTGVPAVLVKVVPNALDFGTVAVGQGTPFQAVTITNQSGVPVTVGPRSTTGDFTIAGSTCGAPGSTLAPNASCTVSVIFTPTTTGARSGQLSLTFGGQVTTVPLTGNGSAAQPPVIEVTPQPLTWGDVTVKVASAPKDLTIKNTGAGPLNIASVAVTAGGSEYKITADQCTGKSLANGQSCTVTLVFTPSTLGDRAGELTILSNAGTTKATLGGKGVTFAVNVDPNPVDFGSVAVNEEAPEKIVTITIPGVVAPPNGSFSITGPNASEFRINSRECSAALPDGTKCTVRLGFKPADVGERSATLQGTFGTSQTPFSVVLKGAGGVPIPSIQPNPVDFGSVLLGAVSAETAATVANKGDGKLTPGVASVTGDNVADFTFVADNCNGKTLLRDQSCTVVLRFSPASAGARNAVLNVPGVGTVNLTGTGSNPAAPASPTNPTNPSNPANPTNPTTPTTAPTTPTSVPSGPTTPAATPTIRLSRPLGAPGEVITIEGTGFRPNTQVALRWVMNPLDPQGRTIALTTVTTDAAGSFAATPAVIFLSDPSGPRVAEANGGPDQTASAPFLVVPATMQRSDNEALNSRRTQLLYRR